MILLFNGFLRLLPISSLDLRLNEGYILREQFKKISFSHLFRAIWAVRNFEHSCVFEKTWFNINPTGESHLKHFFVEFLTAATNFEHLCFGLLILLLILFEICIQVNELLISEDCIGEVRKRGLSIYNVVMTLVAHGIDSEVRELLPEV